MIEAAESGELLPRVADDPTDWRCKMCSHRERCWNNGAAKSQTVAKFTIPADLSIPGWLDRIEGRTREQIDRLRDELIAKDKAAMRRAG